jgi:Calcium-binding EGF domain
VIERPEIISCLTGITRAHALQQTLVVYSELTALIFKLLVVDVDECNGIGTNKCSSEAACVNIPGSYLCQCADGYRIMADQRTCQG